MNKLSELNALVDTPELDVVRVVCFDVDGKVLLVKEFDDDNWKLPGGKIHAGETILQAIQREVQEELGARVEPDMITRYTKQTIPHSVNFRHIVAVTIDPGTVRQTEEVAEYARFKPTGVPPGKFHEHITTAIAFIEG